eukprot:SAG11_NODE_25801_length_353_cov_24.748031_1_plen_84_part_10
MAVLKGLPGGFSVVRVPVVRAHGACHLAVQRTVTKCQRSSPRGLGELAVLCKGLPGSVDSHVQARVIKTIESWNAAGFYSEVKS